MQSAEITPHIDGEVSHCNTSLHHPVDPHSSTDSGKQNNMLFQKVYLRQRVHSAQHPPPLSSHHVISTIIHLRANLVCVLVVSTELGYGLDNASLTVALMKISFYCIFSLTVLLHSH